jgi:myosin-crossreactive antigen
MSNATETKKDKPKARLVGGGIGSPTAAAFMIRDGGGRGPASRSLEEAAVLSGSLDGAGDAEYGYALFPDRVRNFVAKPEADGNDAEIPRETCGHRRFDPETFDGIESGPVRNAPILVRHSHWLIGGERAE